MTYKIIKFFDEVMTDPRLRSLEEKIIVNHVLGFQNEGKCTFSSDATISRLICRSEAETYQLILSLANRNIVKPTYPRNGTARFLSVVTPGSIIQDCGNDNLDIFSEL
jgi:hypothetical protein